MNFDITALTLIDYAALLVLLVSGGLATLRGMTRELMGLVGWPIAIIAAKVSAPYLQPTLAEIIKIEGISDALAWGVPFVIVVVLWFAFSSLVSPGLSKAGLGGLDRWLGFLFGLIRGFIIVLLIYTGAVVTLEGEDRLPSMVADSQVTPMLRGSAHVMSGLLPTDIRERVVDSLPAPDDATTEIKEAGDALGEAGASGLELFEDETAN